MPAASNGTSDIASCSTLPSENNMQASTVSTSSGKDLQVQSVPLKMAANDTRRPSIFPFLKLPGEVRNMIYRFKFQMPERIFLDTSGYSQRGSNAVVVHRMIRLPEEPSPSGQLLRVNKQIYREGLPIILEVNGFTIARMKNLELMLQTINPTGRSSIRDLAVYWDRDTRKRSDKSMKKTFSLLCECTNLHYLSIYLPFLPNLEAIGRLVFADSSAVMKPLPGLKKLLLGYTGTAELFESDPMKQLESMYQKLVGPAGELEVLAWED